MRTTTPFSKLWTPFPTTIFSGWKSRLQQEITSECYVIPHLFIFFSLFFYVVPYGPSALWALKGCVKVVFFSPREHCSRSIAFEVLHLVPWSFWYSGLLLVWWFFGLNTDIINNAGEKVVIPYTKPFVLLQGAGRSLTMITESDTASQGGTANSATVTVWAANFMARGIGFQVQL